MEPPGGRDSRFNLGYSMNLLSGETAPEIYGNPSLGRPSTSLQQLSPRHTMVSSACGGRGLKSDMYDERGMSSQNIGLEACGVNDISEDTYSSLQAKKSPPSNGKKTKGRVKIKMEYIENKLRRYTTFSKRKTGIMKKAYELSTLTGTQVMLLVASETGHVYTFATRKLQPMITSEAGKALIQTCLNSPDPPAGSAGGDQRMSATGFEETELTYNISDEDSKEGEDGSLGSSTSSDEEDQLEDNSNHNHIEKMSVNNDSTKVSLAVNGKTLTKDISTQISKPNEIKVEDEPSAVSSNDAMDDQDPLALNSITNESHTATSPLQSVPDMSTNTTSTVIPTLNSQMPMMVQAMNGSICGSTLTTNSSPEVAQSQFQTVPLLVQTPAGVGYATTPEGMILGLLQAPGLVQPQLVAIPITSTLTAINANFDKKEIGINKC